MDISNFRNVKLGCGWAFLEQFEHVWKHQDAQWDWDRMVVG